MARYSIEGKVNPAPLGCYEATVTAIADGRAAEPNGEFGRLSGMRRSHAEATALMEELTTALVRYLKSRGDTVEEVKLVEVS